MSGRCRARSGGARPAGPVRFIEHQHARRIELRELAVLVDRQRQVGRDRHGRWREPDRRLGCSGRTTAIGGRSPAATWPAWAACSSRPSLARQSAAPPRRSAAPARSGRQPASCPATGGAAVWQAASQPTACSDERARSAPGHRCACLAAANVSISPDYIYARDNSTLREGSYRAGRGGDCRGPTGPSLCSARSECASDRGAREVAQA